MTSLFSNSVESQDSQPSSLRKPQTSWFSLVSATKRSRFAWISDVS
ncbi:hypothetical protein VCHENC02_4860A, partial [Vibrio harveyi]